MNKSEFEFIYSDFQVHEASLLNIKRGEYAADVDVLMNFRQNASFLGTTPEELCFTYALKHIQSLQRATKDKSARLGWANPDGGEGLSQRIADARNYLVLLAAILSERE